ncbi:hypothetical protein BaRGS_00025735 [Batillaria attramentaria]|uniref:Uncharacterized protein n=1 Tax=Batillaria attramentaria TaxID=370345 RepID=A0ABD0K7D3_9CAEN
MWSIDLFQRNGSVGETRPRFVEKPFCDLAFSCPTLGSPACRGRLKRSKQPAAATFSEANLRQNMPQGGCGSPPKLTPSVSSDLAEMLVLAHSDTLIRGAARVDTSVGTFMWERR